MAEARSLTKTRTGCIECKRRKVKCDERKPICTRCRLRPELCSYEFKLSWTGGRPFKKRRIKDRRLPYEERLNAFLHDSDTGPDNSGCSIHTDSTVVSTSLATASHDTGLSRGYFTQEIDGSNPEEAYDMLASDHALILSPYRTTTTAFAPLLIFPSHVLSSPEDRFFLHHYYTQTSCVIFPLSLSSNPLREGLLQAAFSTPYMLYAFLASSAIHLARLQGNNVEKTSSAIARFTHAALSGLRLAMADHSQACRIETISTALALCTSDVISGNMSTWRVHLFGIHRLIICALENDKAPPVDVNPAWMFLMKWYETLDMFAGISGLGKSVGRYGQHRSVNETGYIDEFVGCSPELMPLLARIGRMARMQQKRKELLCEVDGYESETLRCQHGEEMADQVCRTERQIFSLLDRKTHPSIAANPRTKAMADEMELTHQIFVYAALLHLYRRVAGLPKQHVKPSYTVYQIVDTLKRLHPKSTANILILWPVFTAGCETDDLAHRAVLEERMRSIEAFGMGNVSSALRAMIAYWESEPYERWDIFLERQGNDIVLF